MIRGEARRPTVTVVVCTRNRSGLLGGALRSLGEATSRCPDSEVLVVDNASVDETSRVVAEHATRSPVPLRYVREPEVGLSRARNRGWREAAGRFVAFTDDDCRVPPRWLEVAMRVVDEQDQPHAFGGPYYPLYMGRRPSWFRDSWATREPAAGARDLHPEEDLSGGNLFVRHDVFDQIGGFDPSLGMNAGLLAYGEETEFQQRARSVIAGYRAYHDPELWVHHLVRPEKLTLRWLLRERLARGRSTAPQVLGPDRRPLVELFRRLAHSLVVLLWSPFRSRRRTGALRTYLYDHLARDATRMGAALELLHSRSRTQPPQSAA